MIVKSKTGALNGETDNKCYKFGVLVKSLKRRISVIPANPGSSPGQAPESSYFKYSKILWTPVSTGVTTFYKIIKFGMMILALASDLY
jgi:hypothetical protein